ELVAPSAEIVEGELVAPSAEIVEGELVAPSAEIVEGELVAPSAVSEEKPIVDDEGNKIVFEEDKSEIIIMDTPLGAEIRLLQLQKAIEKNIIAGGEVVKTIIENNPEADVTILEETLSKLKNLVYEIREISFEQEADELALVYVEIKSRARDLSKIFRANANELLAGKDLVGLKERIRNQESEKIEEYNKEITTLKNEHNAQKVQAMFEKIDVKEEKLIEQIKEGKIGINEVKKEVINQFKKLSDDDKKQATLKVNEENTKKAVFQKSSTEKLRAELNERLKLKIGKSGTNPDAGKSGQVIKPNEKPSTLGVGNAQDEKRGVKP
ncbi:MAG: hypothetical protein KKB65_06025, partial [Nanoarchaeota archaeon]|nr:hypothetical protein [Nanoarchaeota archaeon]